MASITDILGSIRDNASKIYMDRVPEYTGENLAEIGEVINSDPYIQNFYLNSLVDKVALSQISSKMYNNPLKSLKKSNAPTFGNSVEDIYINPAVDIGWEKDGATLLKTYTPDAKVAYYKMNRKGKYPITIQLAEMSKSFQNEQSWWMFYNNIIVSLYSGDEIDEFILMKKLVGNVIDNGAINVIECDIAEPKSILKNISTMSKNFLFPQTTCNGWNILNKDSINDGTVKPCLTWTPSAQQVILLSAQADTEIDFEYLANIYNMSVAEVKAKTILVDNIPSETYDIYAILADENAFQVRDYNNTPVIRTFDNGSTLEQTFFLHHWQSYDFSMYANAVAFGKKKTD